LSQEQSQSSVAGVELGHVGPIPADSLFTPVQVRLGSFLGGPIAAIYFVRQNFTVLGKHAEARNTLLWGAAFVVGLMILLLFLPKRFPNYLIPITYSWFASFVVDKWQLTKQAMRESGKYQVQSNWRVTGWSLLLFLAFAAMLAIEIFTLVALGWSRD
jgi:hypothetical protein